MYQHETKGKTQPEKSTASAPAANKNHAQAGTKPPVQTRSFFSPSAKPNNTGIPTQMKEKFENLSGFSFDDVKVHYNSDKPAQLQALAYTQGNQVHIAPGQEKHLGHELGHVVQQKQGRVRPTMQLQGMGVNDDERLEREADTINRKTTHSSQEPLTPIIKQSYKENPIQKLTALAYNPEYNRPATNRVITLQHARVDMTQAQRRAAAAACGYDQANPPPQGAVCNHHVPYKMVRDGIENFIINTNLNVMVAKIKAAADALRITWTLLAPVTGTTTYSEPALNSEVDKFIECVANDSRNLFYWPDHTGDGNGTLIDEPRGRGRVSVVTVRDNLRLYQNNLRTQRLIT